MRTIINLLYETFYNVNICTLSVALYGIVLLPLKAQASIHLHYRIPQSQLSHLNLSKFQYSYEVQFCLSQHWSVKLHFGKG